MAARPRPQLQQQQQPPEQLVDYEADSDDVAWAEEAGRRRGPPGRGGGGPERPAAGGGSEDAPDDDDEMGVPAAAAATARDFEGAPLPDAPGAKAEAAGAAPTRPRASPRPAPSGGAAAEHPARSADGWVLFVSGLHPEAQEDDVLDLFEQGSGGAPVKNLSLGRASATGGGSGHALLEFAEEEAARRAVAGLDGAEFLGATLRVGYAFKQGPGGRRR